MTERLKELEEEMTKKVQYASSYLETFSANATNYSQMSTENLLEFSQNFSMRLIYVETGKSNTNVGTRTK
ncbi:hypothetical protein G9A89_011535 [Geosiphon pyriformis]|nr:hypothetical protein G9A89_011535 [Geosiphon pyriformis]